MPESNATLAGLPCFAEAEQSGPEEWSGAADTGEALAVVLVQQGAAEYAGPCSGASSPYVQGPCTITRMERTEEGYRAHFAGIGAPNPLTTQEGAWP